jgi:hypothetical protein
VKNYNIAENSTINKARQKKAQIWNPFKFFVCLTTFKSNQILPIKHCHNQEGKTHRYRKAQK